MTESTTRQLNYSDRLRNYQTEKDQLIRSAADRPASEIAARIDALIKKWRV